MHVAVLTCPYPAKSLMVRDGDIVTVTLPDNVSPEEAQYVLDGILRGLRQALGETPNIHIIAHSARHTIGTLDPERMRALGWVRADGWQ